MRDQTDPKVAIVTGASSGIGRATALALARQGYSLVLAARRQDRLGAAARACLSAAAERGKTVTVRAQPTDVARPEQVEALVAAALAEFGRIDVMVNNAGYGVFARVHETTDREMRDLFDVNYFGVFHGCRAVAPVMIAQGRGHIFNVSSVIGHRGTPFQGAYCATKFALRGLTDALRVELKPHGVRVTSVCPGLTATEFREQTRHGQIESSLRRRLRRTSADQVARQMVAAIGENRPRILFSAGGKLLMVLNAVWPGLVDAMMGVYHRQLTRQLRP